MADVMEDAAAAPEALDDRRRHSSNSPTPPLASRRRDPDDRDQRDRSPELPPPPPLPSSGPPPSRIDRERVRERERDTRRSSPSPPPYRRRDRSPPRRSPPPTKRLRRDDGGYERRRGSPRGGFGHDVRRYGYDYGDGYNRDGPGRRHGYGDEWPRHMSYPLGRAGYGDGNVGATEREGLMSYKQFIQELEDDILPSEAERRYEEYRTAYITTQKRAYFEAHKDEDWLKDKYHPTNLVTVIDRRNEQARAAATDFLLDLQSGSLDLGPGFTAASHNKSDQFGEPVSEDEADNGGKRRRHGGGPVKGFDLLGDAPKAHLVSSDPRRIQLDIEQAQALVRKLDSEKGIADNVLGSNDHEKSEGQKSHSGSIGPIIIIRGLTTVKGLEGVELLDTLITYLWRIHGVDYYGMLETNERKGLRHVRADSKGSDGYSESAAEWEKKIDSFWQQRLDGQDPLEVLAGKEKMEAASAEVLDPLVRKIRDEKYGWKYGCGAKGCTKLFHAPEFVHKHLRLKHSELVVELTAKVREDLYFENYMNDPEAPGGKPIMRVSAPRDRVSRRRPLEHRLRDDRGSRREHDGAFREGDEDRYNRGIPSPSRGKDDGSGDDYDGHGLHGAPPFSSDMPPPPPVLMPVPGAGPLGPFVPAPPEVAMRMLREQGGPPPFEANGGLRGRKRPDPQAGSAAPVFSVPQPFRQDPRRMRSYHDLDAPEDEVTVIDYRSL